MRIELTHDILAQKVYTKVSAEEKALRKMERFIADRYEFYHGKGNLLTSNELNYINPYLGEIDLPVHLQEFVKQGTNAHKRRRLVLVAVLSLAFLALIGAAGTFAGMYVEAKRLKEDAEKKGVLLAESLNRQKTLTEEAKEANKRLEVSISETQRERDRAKRNEDLAIANAEKERQASIAAYKAKRNADSLRVIAFNAKGLADSLRINAEGLLIRAVESEKQAFKLLRLTIAQSLAAKSRLMAADSAARKGRLALKAWQLHNCNEGRHYDAAVHVGLYFGWKAFVGENGARLSGHTSTVRAMLVQGNQVFTTGSDGRFLLHNLQTNQRQNLLANRYVNRALALSPDGKTLLGGSDRPPYLEAFPAGGGAKTTPVEGQPAAVWDITWGKTGFFVAGMDGVIRFAPNLTTPLKAVGRGSWRKLALSPDGKWLAGVSEGSGLQVWATGAPGDSLKKAGSLINDAFLAVAWSGSGKYLAAGNQNGSLHLWEMQVRGGQLVRTEELVLTGHRARVSSVAFSGDSLLASGSYDSDVRVWFLKGGSKELQQHLPLLLDDHPDWVESLAFSPDGQTLLAGCKNGLIRKWPLNGQWMANQLCSRLQPQVDLTPSERSLYIRESRKNLGEDECPICP
jgi:WD40 repeat protein